MSVSSIESFTEGAESFDQEKYKSLISTYTEPNPKAMEAEFKKPLSERIIRTPLRRDGIYAEYVLDDIKVHCPSDEFRKHQVHLWNNHKKQAEDKHWAWSVTTIGAALIGIAGGIGIASKDLFGMLGTSAAATVEKFAPWIAGAGFVLAAVSIFFVISESYSISDAEKQIDKWKADPVAQVGRERNKAHAYGFSYIYSHDLKLGNNPSHTRCFHPKQVEHEYKKYADRFFEKLLPPAADKRAWMDEFSSYNPLASALMKYGFGHVPEHMDKVVQDYTKLEAFLKDIRTSYEDFKSKERTLAKEHIDVTNKERNTLLHPSLEIYNTQLAAAKKIRDDVLDKHPLQTDPANEKARANYNAAKKILDEDYALRTAPITKKYDAKVKEIEQQRDARIAKLEAQKSHQLINNYNAAHELLVRGHDAWTGKVPYQAVNFAQYFPWQGPQAAQPVWYPSQPAPMPYYPQPVPQPQYPAGYYVQPQQPLYTQPTGTPAEPYPATYTEQTMPYYPQAQQISV
ncbi:MAG: hypothetical protein JSS10_09585 [Verrucomicrobia bacterium]|nr:hypothetical protein [Verrucomicrobiota bacterium]